MSYSHRDERWASWLHKSLETYRVPKRLVGKESPHGLIPPRFAPIFRDRDELATATNLGETLTRALDQSQFQIAICSMASAKSRWVNEEILAFKRLGRESRIFCLLVDGEPGSSQVPNGTSFTSLVNQQNGGVDLTLLTKDSSGTFPIIGVSVAPGTGIDLRACGLKCAIINDSTGHPAAQLSQIKLAEGSSFNATVFRVKDIPDCRYAFKEGFPASKRTLCASKPGVVVGVHPNGTTFDITFGPNGFTNTGLSPGALSPAALYLNVTPLLPKDVTSSFDNSGVAPKGLPKLLVSRQYRGQQNNSFLFGAMFVVLNPNVHYTGTFGGEYNVPGLEGDESSLGCLPTDDLLKWDVTTSVSETYVSVGGKYIDSLANSGCGSVKGEYARMSLLPYDLEVAPDTYAPTIISLTPKLTVNNDAMFARLTQSLYNDLGYALRDLACKQADQSSTVAPPLTAAQCAVLKVNWDIGLIKLGLCVEGAFKDVHHDYGLRQFCQYFLSYGLDPLISNIPTSTPSRDIANRIGELRARAVVLRHLYVTRFLPSIPNKGFCSEDDGHHDSD
ncbi:MAG: toll/interleukin-1 receptor domain-containing protein [Pseudomonadota bacterium]